jgi:hypothetical protein
MKKYEAIERLYELQEDMYEALSEMKRILKKMVPGEYESARRYWLSHIDMALSNRGGWMGANYSLNDSIQYIEDNIEDDEAR